MAFFYHIEITEPQMERSHYEDTTVTGIAKGLGVYIYVPAVIPEEGRG